MGALKVLVVDDEEGFRNVLKSVLENEGHVVRTAKNGKVAQEHIALEEFGLVISDIRMPECDGLTLLKTLETDYPAVPVVLMTGFSKIIETKDAYNRGAKAFLTKPFKREELLKAIEVARATASGLEVGGDLDLSLDTDFCRVSVSEFISGKSMNFEIYIRLGPNKFTMIAHQGEDLDLVRIRALKAKGVDFLYIKKEDFAKHVGFNLSLMKTANKNSAMSREKKLQIARTANAVIMENIFVTGVSIEKFNDAKDVTESTLTILTESTEALNILAALQAAGDPLYTHSLGVSLFSVLIAKQIGWSAPSVLFKIATAGLFHDIGMKEIDPLVCAKSRAELTMEEVKLLETHSAKSAEILSSIPAISSDILQVIVQHHESIDGHGYPGRLQKGRINPVAKLLSVADEFCELAIKTSRWPGMPGLEALTRLKMVNGASLDPQFLKALDAVFDIL